MNTSLDGPPKQGGGHIHENACRCVSITDLTSPQCRNITSRIFLARLRFTRMVLATSHHPSIAMPTGFCERFLGIMSNQNVRHSTGMTTTQVLHWTLIFARTNIDFGTTHSEHVVSCVMHFEYNLLMYP